jgi:hypothetical protein
MDMDKVRCTLRQMVRDWSADGVTERDQCYQARPLFAISALLIRHKPAVRLEEDSKLVLILKVNSPLSPRQFAVVAPPGDLRQAVGWGLYLQRL